MAGRNLLAGVSPAEIQRAASGGRNLLEGEDKAKIERDASEIIRSDDTRRRARETPKAEPRQDAAVGSITGLGQRPQVRSSASDQFERRPVDPVERERNLANPEVLRPVERAGVIARAGDRMAELEQQGYIGQQRVKLGQMGLGLGAGLARTSTAVVGRPDEGVVLPGDEFVYNTLIDFARTSEAIASRPVAGTTSWEDVKNDPTQVGKFILDEGPSSLAITPIMLTPAGQVGLGLSFTGQIAQERAQNNNREDAELGDVMIAAPFAAGSVALERAGIESIFRPGVGNVAMRIGKAGAGEAVTEGAQGLLEGLGGSIGTERGVQWGEIADRAAAGTVVGFGSGAGFRGGIELVDGTGRLVRRRADDGRLPAPGNIERAVEAASTPTQADIDSPLDTGDIAEGKAIIAQAGAEKATERELNLIGMPGIGQRVTITDPELGTQSGTMRDRFTGEDGSGVVIELDDGKIMREFDDTLADLGISITAETPLAEADALDAQLAAAAQQAISPSAPDPAAGEAPSSPTAPPLSPAASDGGAPVRASGKRGEVAGVLGQAGYSPAVVAGFLGNFEVEGGYEGARGDGGSASGIAQWRNERRDNFRRQFGKEPHEATAAEQARFVVWEMSNPAAAGMTSAQRDRILAAKTPEEAAELIDQFYERSSGAHRDRRKAEARRFAGDMPVGAAPEAAPEEAADPNIPTDRRRAMLEGEAQQVPAGQRREPVQDDMFGGPSRTESEVAAREALPAVLEQAQEEAPDLDLAETARGLRVALRNLRADRASGVASSSARLEDYEGTPDDVPQAILDAANANPAIIEAIAERAGLPPVSQADEAEAAPIEQPEAVQQDAPQTEPAAAPPPANQVQITDSASGKGIIVSGLSNAQAEMLRSTVPQAKAAPMSGGRVTYSKKHEAAIRAALAQDAPSAQAERTPTKANFDTPAFKRAMKSIGDLPHRESPVAADMVKGWNHGQERDLFELDREAAKLLQGQDGPVKTYREDGFNPRQGYIEAFYAAVMGESVQVRAVGSGGNFINAPEAVRRIKERLGDGPAPAAASPRQPTNQEMLKAAQDSGRLEIVDARPKASSAQQAINQANSVRTLRDWSNTLIPNPNEGGELGENDGGPTKRAFLQDAETYLRTVAKMLEQRGFAAKPGAKITKGKNAGQNKPGQAVSVNPAGPASSGDVTLSMFLPDGRGVYVDIGTAMATPRGGISLMARGAKRSNPYSGTGRGMQNQWLPVNLTAEELADRLVKIAEGVEPETQASPASPTTPAQGGRAVDPATDSLERMGRDAEAEGIRLEVYEEADGSVELSLIEVDRTRQGVGTRWMNRLTAWADANGKTINLTPVSVNDEPTVPELIRFYERFGFQGGEQGMVRAPASRPMTGTTEAERSREAWQDMFDAAGRRMRERLDAVNPESLRSMLEAMDERDMRLPDGDLIEMVNPHRAVELGYVELDVDARGNRTGKITEAGRAFVRGETAEASTNSAPNPSGNRFVTDEEFADLKAEMAQLLNPSRLNSGLDPRIMYVGTRMAIYHIERGTRRFIAMSKAIAADLGVRPADLRRYLRNWYNGARDAMEDSGASIEGMDDADTVRALLGSIEDWGDQVTAVESTTPTAEPAVETTTTPPATAVETATAAAPDQELIDRLIGGDPFRNITDARAFLAQMDGAGRIEPGTPEAKRADERIEAAIVQAARQIISVGRARGRTPLQIYRQLVDLYARQPNLAVRTSTSVEQQAYSTPVPLAYLASERAGIGASTTVYEPTAGNGALLIGATPANVVANELNPDRAAALRRIYPEATVTQGDAADGTLRTLPVDVVIANPPFGAVKDEDGDTIRYNLGGGYFTNEVDHAIAMRALEAMKNDGRAVLIVGAIAKTITDPRKRADAYNGKAKREFYYRLYSEYNVTDHFTVPGELYSKQGAGWPVDVIVIEGRGKSSLSLPSITPPRIRRDWIELEQDLVAANAQVSAEDGAPADRPDRAGTEPAGSDGADRPGSVRGRPDDGGLAQNEPAAIRNRPDERQPGGRGLDAREGERRGGTARPERVQQPGRDRQRVQTDAARLAETGEQAPAQVPYVPASGARGLDTLVPFNMQTSTADALDALEQREGSVDAYVADKLGYQQDEIAGYFSAEQVDALALAISNMEAGSGFIIGDQTGIGKGRVVAGVIRYALREGRKPIFVTEKPNLYADMYRDMNDIGLPKMLGRDVEILMTNAAQNVPLDEEGKATLKTPAAKQHNAMLERAAAGEVDFDVLFTTYSQLQTQRGETTPRQRVIEAMAPGAILVFDESHNAGGSGPADEQRKSKKEKSDEALGVAPLNRAQFARKIAGMAHGVFFSSATYAKRPEVMDLYASTDMRYAVSDIKQLGEAIAKGGIPMQQIVASMLAEAGQYLRRERSFEGVSYETPRVEVDRELYSGAVTAISAIREFEDTFVKPAIKEYADLIRQMAGAISTDGAVGEAGAHSTNFTSVMHNLVAQMLLALKADVAAERAIAAIKEGKKPVVTVANTMGAFIQEYAQENNVGQGGDMPLDFRAMLKRYLKRTREFTVKKPFSPEKGEKVYLDDELLGPAGSIAYREIEAQIDALDIATLPISPIDHIRQKLIASGYKVGEITGRQYGLDYSGVVPTLRIRSAKETSIKGKRAAITGFNDGSIDAMILNQSGATGLSLHASEKFKDKRPRVMVIAQAELNVDTHMQMLGRIHRTGQVVLPSYQQLVAAVPAEMRPAAVLAKKMASLNANTTGARGSAVTSDEVPDFMNEFGDEIAARLMEEDPALHVALGKPLNAGDENKEGLNREDAARKVTGRITLLPLERQEDFYERFIEEYTAYLAQKEAAGEATLEAKTLPLDARVIERKQLVGASKEGSPFGAPVFIETLDVKRLGKPFEPEQVLEQIAETIGIPPYAEANEGALNDLAQEGERWMREEIAGTVLPEFDAYARLTIDETGEKSVASTRERLDANRQAFVSLTSTLYPGAGVEIFTDDGGSIGGIVTGFAKKGNAKNPLALSTWHVTIAVADSARQLTFPLTQLRTRSMPEGPRLVQPATQIQGFGLVEAFRELQIEAREKRTMMTGNILAAFEQTNNKGQIVNFVGEDGSVRPGIMMRRGYDHASATARQPVVFRNPQQVAEWVRSGETAFGEGVNLRMERGIVTITVPQSKKAGGRYFLDQAVRAAIGGDFVSRSGSMQATVTPDRLEAVAAALSAAGAKFEARDNKERAREIVAGDGDGTVREDGATFDATVAEPGDMAYTGLDDAADPQQRNAGDPLRGDQGSVPARERNAGRARVPGQLDRGSVDLRELGIAAEIQRTGSAALVGREITAPSELAEMAQVYRDPRHETFRVFFMRGNEIVHATGATLRLPDQAPLIPGGNVNDFTAWLAETMQSSGADGYYLLHNHPSGDPTPSREDVQVTTRVAQAVPGFRSHVVINSNRFAFITAEGGGKVREQTFGPDALTAPSKPGPLLGRSVSNQAELAAAAKLAQRDGYVTIIGTNKLKVRAVIDVPVQQIQRDEKILLGLLRRMMRRSGSTNMFLVGDANAVFGDKPTKAYKRGLLTEVISTDGTTMTSGGIVRDPDVDMRNNPFAPISQAGFVAEDRDTFDASPMPERDEAIILAGKDPTWKGQMAEAYNAFRRAAQDRYLPLLRVQRDIELRQGAPLPPSQNPYLGEELSAGRIGARLEELMEDRVRPLFDAMADEGITTEELETYLYARHAPERNARMQEINPDIGPGQGSGMTDLEARAVMSRIRNQGKMEAMQRLARRVDAIRDEALDRRVEYGLMSEREADEWRATYEHYVPLRGFRETGGDPAEAARINRSGGGINVRGRESKAAFGRRSVADSPLAYLILQAEEAIVRGETNRVAQRFVELARANPDDNFWKVNKVTSKQRINPDTGLVESYLVTQLTAEDKDWTVVAKFDGKERRVTMNRANPEARALADAMRNLTQHQLDFVTKYLGAVNRFLSRVNTSFNPEFVISNAIRDVQTAAFNLTATEQNGLVTDTLKNYRAALVASTKGAFGNRSGEWGRWYQEFIEDGGRVYFNQVEDVELIKKRMRRVAEQVNAARGAKDVRLQAKRMARAAVDTIENVNLGVENAIRLAAYRAAREKGMSRERAASLAKNLTVNFNRRGTFGPVANALYLFFNASVQGSVRMLQATRSRRLQKVLAGVALSAAALEIMNAMVSGDDDDGESFYDKIPDYEKRSNLIVMLPDGKSYFKFPLPYGYNVFYGAGRTMAEIARRGGDRWKESAASLLTTAIESFNPIGFDFEGRSGWEALVSFVTPTVFDPIVDLSQNRDFTGRPIMPENNPYGPPEPEHQRYFGGTAPYWVGISEFLNRASGGDDVTEGAVSVSPAALEHLFGTVVGAAGSFINRTVSIPSKVADPEFDFDVSDVPFARKAVGSPPRWYNKSTYYERIGTIEAAIRDTKDYLDREQFDSAREYAEANAAVLSMEPAMKEAEREMRKIRKAKRENEGLYELGKIDRATFDRERAVINDAEDIVINSFNTAWNQSVRNGREFGAEE